jgi:hypothetical protein
MGDDYETSESEKNRSSSSPSSARSSSLSQSSDAQDKVFTPPSFTDDGTPLKGKGKKKQTAEKKGGSGLHVI